MISTGVGRRVDELGRIVIPIEIRQMFDINIHDTLEFYSQGKHLLLRKFEQSCIFCGKVGPLIFFKEKNICPACMEALATAPRTPEGRAR